MRVKICILISLLLTGIINARTYTNGGGDQLWSNPANWEPYGVPGQDSPPPYFPPPIWWWPYPDDYGVALLLYNLPPLLIDGIDGYAEVDTFITGGWGGTDNTELLSGAYFYIDNGFLGEATAETLPPCVFTNNGGDFVLTGQLMVGGSAGTGNASYVQNAGTLQSGWRLWVSAADDVLLNGGTATVGTLQVDATALVDFSGGDMYFGGYSPEDAAALVLGYKGDGRMTAFGGTGVVNYAFDEAQWKMHVWGEIPEPATMSLLALGGLLLARKRK